MYLFVAVPILKVLLGEVAVLVQRFAADAMIEASKAGFLFRTTEEIKAEYPQIPAYETYDELLEAIKKVLA